MTEQEKRVTVHVSVDGTVYLRTQHGNSAAEITEALKPYVGRTMSCDLPNLYGHYHRYRAVLREIKGDTVTLYVPGHDYLTVINAFDAFGSHCTMIDKED